MRSGTAVTEWPGDVHHPAEVILVKNSSFRAFHYDLEDGSDSILCLSGGKKLWLLAPASNVGRTWRDNVGVMIRKVVHFSYEVFESSVQTREAEHQLCNLGQLKDFIHAILLGACGCHSL